MAFTFFFRDRFILEILCQELMPKFQTQTAVKVWDAGCALGQEPYTFAIIMAETIGKYEFEKLKIIATDLDPNDTFAPIVNKATYRKFDLSRMPDKILEKYFLYMGDDNYLLIDWVKNALTFHKQDLTLLKPIENNFDAIICKNVLLHLQYEERVKVITMFGRSLVANGLLSLEQTQPLPVECEHFFEKLTPDSSIYRKINHPSSVSN